MADQGIIGEDAKSHLREIEAILRRTLDESDATSRHARSLRHGDTNQQLPDDNGLDLLRTALSPPDTLTELQGLMDMPTRAIFHAIDRQRSRLELTWLAVASLLTEEQRTLERWSEMSDLSPAIRRRLAALLLVLSLAATNRLDSLPTENAHILGDALWSAPPDRTMELLQRIADILLAT